MADFMKMLEQSQVPLSHPIQHNQKLVNRFYAVIEGNLKIFLVNQVNLI